MNTQDPPRAAATAQSHLTTAPIQAGQVASITPEFIDVGAMRPLFGVRRTTTFRLLKEGEIKSLLLRRRGGKTGRRLISVSSVREYFARTMAEQEAANN